MKGGSDNSQNTNEQSTEDKFKMFAVMRLERYFNVSNFIIHVHMVLSCFGRHIDHPKVIMKQNIYIFEFVVTDFTQIIV